MKYLFYTNSHTAWQGLYESIEDAQKSVYIEMYILVDDIDNFPFVNLLCEKAKSGVHVKVIVDFFGSFALAGSSREKLRTAGVELLFFKKIFRRLHKKIIIVDDRIGFVGGVNIHKSAEYWDDLLIRVEGKIVQSLIRSFRKVYKICGGKDYLLLQYKKKAPFGRTRIWFLEHIPWIRSPRLKDKYKQMIVRAKKNVVIVSPYFLPHRWLKTILRETVARGVGVHILVPRTTDVPFITRANKRYMILLSKYGIQFYLAPVMNHSKLLLVDNRLALVGSQNIDALSFDFNVESGVFFDDPGMVSDLKVIVEKWKRESTPFNEDLHVTVRDRIVSYWVKFLQPFL